MLGKLINCFTGLFRKKTASSQLQVIFTHTDCGSSSVEPLGLFFPGWKEPAFQCLGCALLTNQGISARLVDPNDQSLPTDGSVIVHEIS